MKFILKNIYRLSVFFSRAIYKIIIMSIKKSMFAECGKNVHLGKKSNITLSNTYVGNNVSIGDNAIFMSTIAKIFIGNYVMFGPGVTIITGNHRTDVIGERMIDVHNKLEENDQDVVIEEDVWIGANVTILKGVTIGKGSIVAAGSVVTKSIQPYSIVGGNPAKLIRKRFSQYEIEKHESIIKYKQK